MKTLGYLILTAAVGLVATTDAAANPIYAPPPGPGCSGPGCAGGASYGGYYGPHSGQTTLARELLNHGGGQRNVNPHRGERLSAFFQNFNSKPKLPVFQAAPWYNYWPYDGHFLTPAPISGQFYGPPMTGNFPVNPYFPGAGYAGFGGPVQGGPPPGWPAMPPPSAGR